MLVTQVRLLSTCQQSTANVDACIIARPQPPPSPLLRNLIYREFCNQTNQSPVPKTREYSELKVTPGSYISERIFWEVLECGSGVDPDSLVVKEVEVKLQDLGYKGTTGVEGRSMFHDV